MESCLYEGVVHHERLRPVNHRFRYRLFLSFLDLEEVPTLLRAGLLSERRFAAACFRRADHFGDPRRPLAACVRDLVQQQTGTAPAGPIRLLTQLRTLGYYFSPLNLFFCLAGDGRTVEAIVAEVQNTPWLQRQCYVLWRGNQHGTGDELRYRHPKTFHVSPFMGMDVEYRWRTRPPGERLTVGIENAAGEEPLFRASLDLRRVPLSRDSQFAMLCRYPLMTARITAAIYLQAFHLWRMKCPYYPHPGHHKIPAAPASAPGPLAPTCSPGSSAVA